MPPRIKAIPVAGIVVPEIRITAVYDDELTELLHGSLEVVGQLIPILVVGLEEGYELVDGLHRLQEAKDRGDRTIPGVVLEGDSVTAMCYNIVANTQRGKTRASEVVRVIDSLVHTHGLDVIQIQERIGMTREYIERLWKIGEAAPSVLDALDRETIGVGVAFEVSRLPNFEQQEAVMNTVHVFRMTVPQVKNQVDEVLKLMASPPEPAAPIVQRDPPPPSQCEVCHRPADPNLLVAVQLDPRCFGKIAILVEEEDRLKGPTLVDENTRDP